MRILEPLSRCGLGKDSRLDILFGRGLF